ncbi:hypothetical protein C8R47DRAFT_1064430 [Mycena vitilis]|nr:hypothetical protein C8R47DRAFT_1064430 [Mycena vitilis]
MFSVTPSWRAFSLRGRYDGRVYLTAIQHRRIASPETKKLSRDTILSLIDFCNIPNVIVPNRKLPGSIELPEMHRTQWQKGTDPLQSSALNRTRSSGINFNSKRSTRPIPRASMHHTAFYMLAMLGHGGLRESRTHKAGDFAALWFDLVPSAGVCAGVRMIILELGDSEYYTGCRFAAVHQPPQWGLEITVKESSPGLPVFWAHRGVPQLYAQKSTPPPEIPRVP